MRISSTIASLLVLLLTQAVMAADDRAFLVPHRGDQSIDRRIAALQEKIKSSPTRSGPLAEQLGWSFVSKARLSNDPGYYKLAEQCAAYLAEIAPHDFSALLLRGHIDHALHRFHDAEIIGRELAKAEPERWESHALLGDSLMEQGQLSPAVESYQKMIDLKPCAQTYARVAHARWLKGDLDGAVEMMLLAVEAGSTRDPEPAA